MSGYAPKLDLKLGSLAPQAGIVSLVPISKSFPITSEGSKNFIARVKTSTVTQVGTLTLTLQTSMDSTNWVASKTATFTAAGYTYIKIQQAASADQTYTPLLNTGRIVLTMTDAGDRATIDSVEVLQED